MKQPGDDQDEKTDATDILRFFEAGAVPRDKVDKVAELKALHAAMDAHHEAVAGSVGILVEWIVATVVFKGCAPILFMVLVSWLFALWAWQVVR